MSDQIPDLDMKYLRDLVEESYGLRADTWKPLNSYEDKTFFLSNCYVLNANSACDETEQYVLKITNRRDSNIPGMTESQTSLMLHMRNKGLICPIPKLDLTNRYCSVHKIYYQQKNDDKQNQDSENKNFGYHKLRLLLYVPGILLKLIKTNAEHFHQIGVMLGDIHKGTNDFDHPFLENGEKCLWSLHNAHVVKNVVAELETLSKQMLVLSVLEKFVSKIEAIEISENLPYGVLHGDLNEMNILVAHGEEDEGSVKGFIDFGDCHKGYLVFDLGITIAYMMLLELATINNMEIGRHIIKGYQIRRRLTLTELSSLRLIVMARLCQSLTYGYYTWKKNPLNSYVLETQKNGWKILEFLNHVDDAFVLKQWMS